MSVRAAWTLGAFGFLLAAGAPSYEPARTFEASSVLPSSVVKGPHHTVQEAVELEEFYQSFRITTEWGEIEAHGRTMLTTRVAEVDALARLAEVSKTEVFVKAAGGAVLNIGRGFVSAVRDPAGTVKGIGSGLKRLGVNLGRIGKRAADSVTKDEKKPEGPDEPGKEKALNAAGGAANSVLGVNGAARRWASKLGVDPYTTNPLLHQALVDVGKIDAAGSIATRIFVPIPALIGTTATVGGLVWGKDPEEVRKINESRLTELGVTKEASARYLINGNYTLTSQTRFIAALHAVKVRGCSDFVEAASQAEDEREALFFVESAEMLSGLSARTRVSALLPDSRALVAKTGARAVALLPVDWLRWTEDLHRLSTEMASRAKRELGATVLEARITGTATEAAKAGLGRIGWRVKEQVAAGPPVSPAS